MSKSQLKLETALRESGQSITQPRLAVFNYMVNKGPVSIYDVVSACLLTADRASIYRTLALFRQLGIIQDLVVAGRKVIELSDEFSGHHHHLSCTSCGKSLDISDPGIERRLAGLAATHGFSAISHQIEVSGLCSNCR